MYLSFLGQIELYTHLPVMKQFVEKLQHWEFHVCGVFLVDSQFMVESFKVSYGTDSEVLKIGGKKPYCARSARYFSV